MGWAYRNPPEDDPPAPSDSDPATDEFTGADATGAPTQAQQSAMLIADALASIQKSPWAKALPYIIPIAFGMSVVSWGAYMYLKIKESKHYYG